MSIVVKIEHEFFEKNLCAGIFLLVEKSLVKSTPDIILDIVHDLRLP